MSLCGGALVQAHAGGGGSRRLGAAAGARLLAAATAGAVWPHADPDAHCAPLAAGGSTGPPWSLHIWEGCWQLMLSGGRRIGLGWLAGWLVL